MRKNRIRAERATVEIHLLSLPLVSKRVGSFHNANIAFPADSVTWRRGEELIERYVDSSENPGYPRWFCRHCGSPVPKLSRNQRFWVVPSGSLDSDPGIRPQANIYWAEHATWYTTADDLPKHEGPLADR
jgi:hypothetical protein